MPIQFLVLEGGGIILGLGGGGSADFIFVDAGICLIEVGLRWVFVNGLKWVQKWVKTGLLGARVG